MPGKADPRLGVGALLCAFAVLAAPAARAACDRPQALVPEEGVVGERQPRLSWDAVAGATGYRVRLRSRVPNGRVIALYDAVVTASPFIPPRPLAEHTAKVVVRLNAICGDETSAQSVAAFVIDTSAACALGEVSATAAQGKATLGWEAVPGAASYEVRAYALEDGRLIGSSKTRTPGAQVELREGGAVLSVRPACAGGLGEAVYRVLAR